MMVNQGDLLLQVEVYEYMGGYMYLEQECGDYFGKICMEEWEL